MRISIIIPIYNCEDYIIKCLDSIRGQNDDIEILCINDGSTDSSLLRINEYKKKCNCQNLIIYNQENKGVSFARNIGKKLASGDYLWFVDADDEIEKDAISTLLQVVDETDADVINFNLCRIDSKSKVVGYSPSYLPRLYTAKNEDEKKEIYSLLSSDKSFGLACNFIVKRTVIEECFFPNDFVICEDLVFNMQMYQVANSVVHVDKSLYRYRINSISATHSFNMIKYGNLKSIFLLKKEYAVKNQISIEPNHLEMWYVRCLCDFCSQLLANKIEYEKLRNNLLNDPFNDNIFKCVSKKEFPILFASKLRRELIRNRYIFAYYIKKKTGRV